MTNTSKSDILNNVRKINIYPTCIYHTIRAVLPTPSTHKNNRYSDTQAGEKNGGYVYRFDSCYLIRLHLKSCIRSQTDLKWSTTSTTKNKKKKEVKTVARARKVTRTIASTKVIVMCADTQTAKVDNYEVTIAGTYTDDKKLMKAVTKVVETETLKPVAVVSTEVIETLYGMDEQKFIELAEVLPARTKKDIEETDAE